LAVRRDGRAAPHRPEPHPAEVAELLFLRIEQLSGPAPKTRELLLRSALLRGVREVTSA